MTTQETAAPLSAHPFRTPVDPFDPYAFDCAAVHVPYTGQTRMRLAVSSGLAHGRIAIDPAARDLIAIHCDDGPPPRIRVAAGEIALSWPVSFGDWLFDALRGCHREVAIALHPAVAWSLAIRGGLASFELDLSAGTVARVDVHGGCSDVRFQLPLPGGAVPIRIAGGASRLVVQRPAAAGVALAAAGGMAALRLDDQRFDAIGGSARLETRNVAAGGPHYELQIQGGAANLAIEPCAPPR